MPEETEISGGIDRVADATEKLVLFLDSIGVELSVFAVQLVALLFAAAVLLVIAALAKNREGVARYSAFAGLVPPVAIIGFIVASWVGQIRHPLPNYIAGRVISQDLQSLRVELLDFRGEPIAAGPLYVDSVTGRFGLNYQPRLGDRPRRFRLSKTGCSPVECDIGLDPLRAAQDFQLEFRCEVSQ